MQHDPLDASASVPPPLLPSSPLLVGGYLVPHISITTIKGGAEDGMYQVHLDNRFQITCTHDELNKWGWFIANAMAVAAGYTSFGPNCQLNNPFKTPVFQM
jgi:hypothetical protein